MGKAIHRYRMVSDGDRILVGLSGGKDSLTLMWMLSERRGRIPINYMLHAAYIDPGFEDGFSEPLFDYCRQNGFDLRMVKTDNGLVAHSKVNLENPCFLCARLRRKRLFEVADELGCNKIALGHNKDDLIETLFLNILYSGAIATMKPAQDFFNGKFTIIRPLAYAEEKTIQKFAMEKAFPVFENPCPSAARSKRREVKNMLESLYRGNKKIKGNIFSAMHKVNTDYLP